MGLTLYSELDCQGKSLVIKDKEVNLSKAGLTFNVKVSKDQKTQNNVSFLTLSLIFIFQSAQVEGSPWILYSAERFQEFLCLLEDGRCVV